MTSTKDGDEAEGLQTQQKNIRYNEWGLTPKIQGYDQHLEKLF